MVKTQLTRRPRSERYLQISRFTRTSSKTQLPSSRSLEAQWFGGWRPFPVHPLQEPWIQIPKPPAIQWNLKKKTMIIARKHDLLETCKSANRNRRNRYRIHFLLSLLFFPVFGCRIVNLDKATSLLDSSCHHGLSLASNDAPKPVFPK